MRIVAPAEPSERAAEAAAALRDLDDAAATAASDETAAMAGPEAASPTDPAVELSNHRDAWRGILHAAAHALGRADLARNAEAIAGPIAERTARLAGGRASVIFAILGTLGAIAAEILPKLALTTKRDPGQSGTEGAC